MADHLVNRCHLKPDWKNLKISGLVQFSSRQRVRDAVAAKIINTHVHKHNYIIRMKDCLKRQNMNHPQRSGPIAYIDPYLYISRNQYQIGVGWIDILQ